jgi:hypothetical protein
MDIVQYTGNYWWTFEMAIKRAKDQTMIIRPNQYFSVVKGEPDDLKRPEECWAVTNRYDPRVMK